MSLLFLVSFSLILTFSISQAQPISETYSEIAVLGRGTLLKAYWRPDGDGILVNSDRGAWLYNSDFTLLHQFENASQATLSPSGRFLAAAKADPGQLLIWDTATYTLLKTIDIQIYPRWPWIHALAWSTDESRLAIGVSQQLEVFEMSTGESSLSLSFETPISSLTWRQDDEQLAVSRSYAVDLIDLPEGNIVTTLAVDSISPMALWSPDQQTLATLAATVGSFVDDALKLWSSDGHTLKRIIQAPFATTFAWSPDNQSITAEYRDAYDAPNSLYVWDVHTGARITVLSHLSAGFPYRRPFHFIAWSPDGTQLMTASSDNTVRIFDWPVHSEDDPLELLGLGYQGPITDLAWNADGTQLVSSSEDSSIRIWDVTTEVPIVRLQSPRTMAQGVSWNRLTNQIVFGTESPHLYDWNPHTDKIRTSNDAHRQDVASDLAAGVPLVAYSPDGQMIASGGGDNAIAVWQAKDLDLITRTEGYTPTTLTSLAWSGDSGLVAYNGGPAHVLEVATNKIRTFECERLDAPDYLESIASVALSADGRYLAAANVDFGVCLWEIKTGRLIGRLQVDGGDGIHYLDIQVTELAWSPDGDRLALISPRPSTGTDSEVREWFIEVWSVPTRERLASFKSATLPTNIAWSPDGTCLAVGDRAGLIHIWQRE